MSDSPLDSMAPLEWTHGGKSYALAPRTLSVELLFSARFAANAAEDLDRIRDMIGERSYEARVERQEAMRASGQFAFGGDLAFRWLLSDEGMAEYVHLLMGESGRPAMRRDALLKLAAASPGEFRALWRRVCRRDFLSRVNPAYLEEPDAPPSANGATRPPSTTGSSSP